MTKRTVTNLWGIGLVLALVALAVFATWEAQGQEGTGTGWTPPPGSRTCWRVELGGCPSWAANPQTGGCSAVIDLSVPITGGADVLEQRSRRHGIPLSALTSPEGGLIRYCGHHDHGDGRSLVALCWEHFRRTGIPESRCHPTRQEVLDAQYTRLAGLPPVPELQAGCSADAGLLECRVTGTSGLPGFDECLKTWFVGILLRSAPLDARVPLGPGIHAVGVRCSHPSGQRMGWTGTVKVPAVVVPPPPPPPPPDPECEPLEESRFWRSCQAKGLDLEPCRDLAGRHPGSTLAALLARVCTEDPEPPPPPVPVPPPPPPPATSCPAGQTCRALCPECPGEPDPPAECPSVLKEIGALALALLDGVRWAILPDGRATRHEEGRYIFVSRSEETRLRNQAARAAVAGDCYLPGVPSTGRAGVELVPGEEPES